MTTKGQGGGEGEEEVGGDVTVLRCLLGRPHGLATYQKERSQENFDTQKNDNLSLSRPFLRLKCFRPTVVTFINGKYRPWPCRSIHSQDNMAAGRISTNFFLKKPPGRILLLFRLLQADDADRCEWAENCRDFPLCVDVRADCRVNIPLEILRVHR